MEVTAEQLDTALFKALKMPGDTTMKKFYRMQSVANAVRMYQESDVYFPVLDYADKKIFNECVNEARNIGILK